MSLTNQSSKYINYTGRELNFTRKKSHECVWKSLLVERHPVRTKQPHKNDLHRVTFKNRQHLTKNILGRLTVNNWRHLTSVLDAVPQLSSTAILSTTNIHTFTSADSFRHQVEQSFNRDGEIIIWFQWLSICSRTWQYRRNRCRSMRQHSILTFKIACLIIQLDTNSACSIPRRIFLTRLCSGNRARKAELDISILMFNTRNQTQFPRIDHREYRYSMVSPVQLFAIYLVGYHRLKRTALSVDVFLRCQQIEQRFVGFMWCLVLQFWYQPVETMYSSNWIMFTVYFICVDIWIFYNVMYVS